MRTLIISAGLLVALSFNAFADDDTFVKIQEMMNDLGGPQMQKKNNGKTLKCANGGTKKITITSSGGGTTYHGVYNNCKEYGNERGGEVTISTGGGGNDESKITRSPFDKLMDAIDSNNIKLVKKYKNKKLVNQSTTLNIDGTVDYTPLMFAAQIGNLEITKLLIESGANVNAINSNGVNAFWLAANKNNNEVAIYLAQKGSNINTRNKSNDDETALFQASAFGNEQLVDFLLSQKNIDLNALAKDTKGDGVNALFMSILKNNFSIAHKLINAGINVNCANAQGLTPIMLAASRNRMDLYDAIMTKNVDVNMKNENGDTVFDIMKRMVDKFEASKSK